MNPVICLEGGLAVGKSTTAAALAERFGAAVVPEMNRLFRPAGEDPDSPDRRSFGQFVATQPPGWYLERQAERWQMAREAARTHPFAVLDRDPFQPLWYRWAFGYEGAGQTPDDLRAFYRPRLADGTLRFPDGYVLLVADESELRRRKETDATRDRRGFEKQLRFVAPQRRYFAALSALAPDRVRIVDAQTIAGNVAAVEASLPAFARSAATATPDRETALFDAITDWLAANSP